jgi:ankyrin repeat protein
VNLFFLFFLNKGERVCVCGMTAIQYGVEAVIALFDAIRTGDEFAVRSILQYGVDANATGVEVSTPLHCAAEHGCDKIVDILIRAGAIVNALDSGGNTALHIACTGHMWDGARGTVYYGDTAHFRETVAVLLGAGAALDITNDQWCTPLHMACAYGAKSDVEIIRMLDDAGANAEAVSGIGTPVQMMASAHHTEAIRVLRRRYVRSLAAFLLGENRAGTPIGLLDVPVLGYILRLAMPDEMSTFGSVMQ